MFLFRHRANIAMLAFKCLQVDLLVLENISAQHLPEPRVSCRVLSHQETFFFSLISRRYIYSLIWIQIELYLDCGAKTTRLRFGIRGQPKVIALSPPSQLKANMCRAPASRHLSSAGPDKSSRSANMSHPWICWWRRCDQLLWQRLNVTPCVTKHLERRPLCQALVVLRTSEQDKQ